MGGAALHLGNVSEMKTGEGKTLVATLPSYLNALTGKGVHVITVNDYLAEYQSELMGRVHRLLGLETGCILASMTPEQRRAEYAKDITYGTNNEFGFDYLRDNIVLLTPSRARACTSSPSTTTSPSTSPSSWAACTACSASRPAASSPR